MLTVPVEVQKFAPAIAMGIIVIYFIMVLLLMIRDERRH